MEILIALVVLMVFAIGMVRFIKGFKRLKTACKDGWKEGKKG